MKNNLRNRHISQPIKLWSWPLLWYWNSRCKYATWLHHSYRRLIQCMSCAENWRRCTMDDVVNWGGAWWICSVFTQNNRTLVLHSVLNQKISALEWEMNQWAIDSCVCSTTAADLSLGILTPFRSLHNYTFNSTQFVQSISRLFHSFNLFKGLLVFTFAFCFCFSLTIRSRCR